MFVCDGVVVRIPTVASVLWVFLCAVFPADLPAAGRVRVGLEGCVKVGRWAPVRVDFEGTAPRAVFVDAPDPLGDLVRYPLRRVGEGKPSAFVGLFQLGRRDGVPRLVFRHADGEEQLRRIDIRKQGGEMLPAFRQSMALVAMIGKPAGFAPPRDDERDVGDSGNKSAGRQTSVRPYRLLTLTASSFPTDARALDALDVLVLAGTYPLTEQQDQALRAWVHQGGHLIVCRGSRLEGLLHRSNNATRTGDTLLGEWLPVTVKGQVRLRSLDAIEAFAQRKSPIVFPGRIRAARLQDPRRSPQNAGVVLSAGRAGPLIVRAPYGIGRVTFVGLDLDREPLSSWDEVNAIGQKLLADTLVGTADSGSRRLSSAGVTDLCTQLHRIQDDFPAVRRISAWETIGLLLVYILLIGPADYFLVHRVLKRPRLTWFTFPLLVGLATFLSVYNAAERNGPSLRLNQLNIVDIDATADPADAHRTNVRTHAWATLYSPESQRFSVGIRPAAVSDRGVPKTQSAAIQWSGVPENVFGGMYRASGIEIGRLQYSLDPHSLSIDRLPLRLWSSRTLTANWNGRAPGVVASSLIFDEGKLTGTLTHHLNEPITSWILVHGTKLYQWRGKGGAIRPGRSFVFTRDNLAQAGLREVLTARKIAFRGKKQDQIILQQTAYDPAGRDPEAVLRMISFHTAAGGRKYTGLDNFPLGRLDLTPLLPLNRAVLVGRIESPAAAVTLGDEGATGRRTVAPTRSHTFVRIVLPVQPANSP